MNTGDDDDSLSTPSFAFSVSCACAGANAPIASKPASMSRANPVIPFLQFLSSRFCDPCFQGIDKGEVGSEPTRTDPAMIETLQTLRNRLIQPDKRPLLAQLQLEFCN